MRTVIAFCTIAAGIAASASASMPAKPNILYLMSDDMRNEINAAYGQNEMITPFFDSLTARSMTFDNAVCQYAYCSPSRNSFLSGRRPDRTRALNFLTSFRSAPARGSVPPGKDWVAMPQLFKNAGWFTTAAGKIYHDSAIDMDPESWSYPANHTAWIMCGKGDKADPIGSNYCGVTPESVHQDTDEDLMRVECIKRLRLAAAQPNTSWFVGCGSHRPHAEFRVPQGFYGTELYPATSPSGDPITVPKWPLPPTGYPWMSGQWQDGDQKDPHLGCPNCTMPMDHQREVRRWRKAAVTWADHTHGEIYKELEALGEDVVNNTIIVFHADHGYSLGEQNAWSKKSDYHMAVRVPLLIHVPWMPQSHGKSTTVKAELIDLYRTLADLTGITDIQPSVQGMSLKSVFETPSSPSPQVLDKPAFSQIGRCACKFYEEHGFKECDAGACLNVPINSTNYNFMGYSIEADRESLGGHWRYTAWLGWNHTKGYANWNNVTARELYDLRALSPKDPDFYDYDGFAANVAADPANADVVAAMHKELQEAITSFY